MIFYIKKYAIFYHRPSKHLLYNKERLLRATITSIECTKYDKCSAQLYSMHTNFLINTFLPKVRWLPGGTLIEKASLTLVINTEFNDI